VQPVSGVERAGDAHQVLTAFIILDIKIRPFIQLYPYDR